MVLGKDGLEEECGGMCGVKKVLMRRALGLVYPRHGIRAGRHFHNLGLGFI